MSENENISLSIFKLLLFKIRDGSSTKLPNMSVSELSMR